LNKKKVKIQPNSYKKQTNNKIKNHKNPSNKRISFSYKISKKNKGKEKGKIINKKVKLKFKNQKTI